MGDSIVNKILRGDKWIWGIFIALLLISSLVIFSASSHLVYTATYTFHKEYTQPIIKHISILILGFFIVLFFTRFKILRPVNKAFRILAVIGLLLHWALLLYMLLIHAKSGGASRQMHGFMSYQPSEGAILCLLIVLADLMDTERNIIAYLLSLFKKDRAEVLTDKERFWWIFVLTGITVVLIFPENLSTALLLTATVYVMMWIDGIDWRKLVLLFLIFVVLAAAGYGVAKLIDAHPQWKEGSKVIKVVDDKLFHRVVTWESRVKTWSSNANEEDKYKITDKTYQSVHAKRAIARSSIVKFGPGTSIERDFLSEAYSDFLFAIIVEEYGILGGMLVITLYIILFIRAVRIAFNAKTRYQMMLVFGLTFLIMFQAMINMAVSTGLMPVTGQPLPLLSRGGSSTVIISACIGIILRCSMQEPKENEIIIDDNNEYETQIPD